ncbi:MAG: T9SS type A sorting domain-containing protein [candidate division KSB1 bacterium]|nr:T9SS type A sorting domain-containing protein [candidate division KSB1 bacterium]
MRLTAPDGAPYRRFGYSVALSGSTLAVGAPGYALEDGYRGAVYIYRLVNSVWTLETVLKPIDSDPYNYFGSALSLYQDNLLVGAHADTLHGRTSGSAYLFKRVNGAFVQKAIFRSPTPSAADLFGKSVAINASVCAIGAPAAGGAVSSSGTVYVYKPDASSPSGWSSDTMLLPGTSVANDMFGASLSVSGLRLIVGSPFKSATAGKAYVFEKINGSWTRKTLSPADGTLSNRFGFSVAIDGNLCAVGAYRDDVGDFDVGSVYIYRYDQGSWVSEAKLVAADADSGDFFGYSLALYGSFLIVGAPGDNGLYRDSGSIYAYQRYNGNWQLKTKKSLLMQQLLDRFGSSAAVGQVYAMAGAPEKKIGNAEKQGAMYVYQTFEDLALPVLLSSFTGEWEDNRIVLSWTTESEKDNLGFLLERRRPKEPWQKIADFSTHPELTGRGTASEPVVYRFIDQPPGDADELVYRLSFIDINGTAVALEQTLLKRNGTASALSEFRLFPAYPNPFNPQTTLSYELARTSRVEIIVFDAAGRQVRRLVDAAEAGGRHAVIWDGWDDVGDSAPAGVYFVRFSFDDLRKMQKIVLVR